MKIQIKYFASLREKLQCSEEMLDLPAHIITTNAVRQFLMTRDSHWADALAHDKALRTAYNQRLCDGDCIIVGGGELAFFPPVTGG